MKTTPLTRWIWTAALLLAMWPAQAVNKQIIYNDGPNEGFNDPSVGAARRAAFEAAATLWADQLVGNITVRIGAQFNPMGGDGTSAMLGFAGPNNSFSNYNGAPLTNTWYPAALANQFFNGDLAPTDVDIEAEFNSDVDNAFVLGSVDWYYGTDGNPPGNDVDLVTTALHELGHGLGFTDMIDSTDGSFPSGYPDIFSRQLRHPGMGDLAILSDGQRLAALTSDQVFWKGANVVAKRGGLVKMYAPNPYEDGSSISHWDTSLSPDLLMEPFDTVPIHEVDLTREALLDLGWNFVPEPAPNAVAPGHWALY